MSNTAQESRLELVQRLFWTVAGCMALLVVLALGLQVATAPADTQVQYLPDDAYYYLVLTETRAALGTWSFDDGTTLTSGFHPLWAQTLVAFESFRRTVAGRRVRDVVLLCNLLSALALALALVLGLRSGLAGAIVVPWLFLGPIALRSTVAGVEWPLVVLSALGFLWAFLRLDGRTRCAALFAVGAIGSLARTDFGLWPLSFALVCALLWTSRHREQVTEPLRASLWGLGGAVGGWLLSAVFFTAATGHWLQSSVRMKSHWAQFEPYSLEDPLRLLLSLYGWSWRLPAATLPLFALAVLASAAAVAHRSGWWSGDEPSSAPGVTALASAVTLVGYVVVYGRSADVQPWYSANLLVPAGCAAVACMNLILRARPGVGSLACSVVAAVSIVLSLASVFPVRSGDGTWPHQSSQQAAAEDLARQGLTGPLGAFNAGIVRYASGRRDLLNLDGLVNNDILPHARRGTLPGYIDDMGIQYLLDFETMFREERYRRRGGYDDPDFLARLEPVRTWQTGAAPPWDLLVLYRVLPEDTGSGTTVE